MRIAASLALLALLALAAACSGQRGTPRAQLPAPVAFDVEALKGDTRTLSSDAFEGRAPGTPADTRTTDYIARRMGEAGLTPGNNGSWYQDVPLAETTLSPTVALQFRGGGGAVRLAYGRDVMVATKRTGVGEVSVRASDVVFAGYGIVAPELGWNDYAGLDVRGKTVIVLVNDPDWRAPLGQGAFGGRAMTYYGRWTYKHDEAARQGAAAVLIVHETEPAAYPWTVVQTSWSGPQTDVVRADGGAARPALEGWITAEAAERLLAPAGGLSSLRAAAEVKGFRAVPLPFSMQAEAQVASRSYVSRNVVGLLPGRERPAETVLLMAHWDHLGRCEAEAGDDICNGAIDNATGTAGLIALAKAHAEAGPSARSLVFLAVTAEESGLIGSEHYARNPVFPLATTVGGVNMDGLSMLGRTADVVLVGGGKSELEDMLRPLITRQSRRIEPEPTPEKGYYYRSDHFSLAKVGVPMLYAEAGVDVRGKGRAYGQALADDYIANRYHRPGDEYSEAWDWSGAVEDLALYYGLTRQLAAGTAWPNWYPTAEFRAARDASRAAAAR